MIPSEYTPTGNEQGKFSPADILFKYLAFLPLFIISLALSVGAGIFYLRYITPVYESKVKMLVKSGERNPVYGQQGDIVERALYGPRDINMSNEISKLQNIRVVATAVRKNNYHIQYFIEGNLKTSNVFNGLAYTFDPISIKDSSQVYKIRFTRVSSEGYSLLLDEEKSIKKKWTDTLNLGGGIFKLTPKTPMAEVQPTNSRFMAVWMNPFSRAIEIQRSLQIFVEDPNTTIVTFRIRNDNAAMGRSILDALVREYILASVDSKNVASEITVKFIEDRLDSLSRELREIEKGLQIFKDNNDVLGVDQQAALFSNKLTANEERTEQINWEKQMVAELKKYITKPGDVVNLVPGTMGIKDLETGRLVTAFNEMRLQRARDARQLQAGSLQLQQIDKQIEDLRTSILERVKEYTFALEREQERIAGLGLEYRLGLSRIPEKQRRLLEIERQQKVKENLYLYLLQRKEEISITTASTDPAYEPLNPADGLPDPVEPDGNKVRLFALLFGLLAPVGIIYLKDLLNDKLYTRDDISKRTKMPIIGEIGHVEDNRNLVVAHESRNIISEQFRIVRSNLSFFMTGQPLQTILVTSTVSGEGKSFISVNLAAVLALAGKRVALLEFDLRRPRIMRNLGFEKPTKGIANILLGQSTLDEVMHPLSDFENLHIYPSGVVAPNPAELVLGNNIVRFFDEMKARYDYIIIDSAPVGLVSDTFSLAPFVDTTLFVVRHRFTFKRQLEFIDEVYTQRKLPRLWLIVNDLKMGARFGYYGYGYGKGYGYGGYGYGYYGRRRNKTYHSYGADDYYDIQPAWWKKTLAKWRGER